jgi:protoporphyrinogen/coproporphyrinogen III oxidase
MTLPAGRAPDAPLPVVIVGGGMAGLAAAWSLYQANVPVTVLERGDRAGGAVGTHDVGGHVFERGPTTVMSHAPALNELIDAAGLRDRVVLSRAESHRRLVWLRGALFELPSGPMSFLTSPLMGLAGKLRALGEPWVRPRSADQGDETLRAFLERRVGAAATVALADPFVTGVFAGQLDDLGADAFPRLLAFERQHGSLFKGMAAARKSPGGRGHGSGALMSFDDGLGVLPESIRQKLGTRVRFGHEVFGIEPRGPGARDGWIVRAVAAGRHVDYDASAVVLATPSWVAGQLMERVAAELAEPLADIPHPHVASVGLGYRRDSVAHPLDAFGLLCTSGGAYMAEIGLLGVIFASSVFDGRAPEGFVTLNVIMGGSRAPHCADATDSELVEQARAGLAVLLGVRGYPAAVNVTRWPRAIPQYQPGHGRRVAHLRELLGSWKGLHVAGNYLDGVGLEPTVASGTLAARALLADRP